MTACRATLNLEGMLRSIAPSAADPGGAHAAEPVEPGRWRIIAADGSRDACPCPTPPDPRRAVSARVAGATRPGPEGNRPGSASPRKDARADAAEFARLAAGLEMMAAVGLSLPAQGKPKVAMPSGTPDMAEILAAASTVAPPPQEPGVEAEEQAASRRGGGPSGACPCQRAELRVTQVVEAWPHLPHSIQSAILAVVEATRAEG
jgi:hypothetical protein